MTPEDSGKATSSSTYGEHENFTSKEGGITGTAARTEAATKLEKTSSGFHEITMHPVVRTLTNGLQLIVQPETISDSVSVYGRVRNYPGVRDSTEGAGTAWTRCLTSFSSFGSESLDRLAFQKALDDIGANESAGTSFEVSVLTKYFDRGTQLLADDLLHPALPEKAFKTVRKQVMDSVAGLLENPEHLFHRELSGALFPKGDPSLREATTSSVSALTLGNVRDYYLYVFPSDLTAVVVIGNIEA